VVLIKIQPDPTVCRYLFTVKSLYMFRVSQHPSSGVLKTVIAASGTGHNTGTATSLQRGPIGPRWRATTATTNKVVCFYSFLWSLSRLLCRDLAVLPPHVVVPLG